LETLDRLTADASPEFAPRAVDPDAPTLLLYTSGTTGMPKGVLISQTNLSYVERMAREIWAFDAASINLVAMPLFHIGGIGYGMMALSQGGHTVLLDRLDPPSIVETVNRHGVTHSFFVPTVVQRLVDNVEAGGEAPRGLKRILYGAAPIGEPLLRRALALFGCEFSHAYGATETAGTVISLPPDQHDPDGPIPERLRSCGRPLPWVELTLVDPATGQPVATGEVGEIRIRSGMVTQGYWRKPDETAAAITADGWLKTGDAAYRDDDGYVFIHDRYKDMIVSGGENVYPTEIENVLGAHPAVGQVAVIGVAHPKWGETPRAYVVPRAGATPDEAEMIAFTRARLAHYKCPTSIRFVAELPQTASGKILKKDLREIDRVLEAKT
jgi:long-chain acyl-CoA synthetase